jgi:LPXTG-motif cell wall-anchored protein
LNVVKHVVNTYGGTAVASDFTIRVTHNGTDVAGSPAVGVDGTGRPYNLAPGTYLVSEIHADGYYGTFASTDPALGGNITADGLITIVSGEVATIVRTNYQIAPAYVATPGPSATPAPATPPTPVTETGGKLPKTGSPWYNLLALAGGLILLGGVGFGTKKVLR